MGPKKKGKEKKKKKNLFDDDDEDEKEAKRKAEEERLERERIRLEMERELREMKKQKKRRERKEMYERSMRESILKSNCSFFNEFRRSRRSTAIKERDERIWREYADCTVQPFPYDPPALNTYIYAFHEAEETGSFENVNNSCQKLIEIIERVDNYIEHPLDFSERRINNLLEVKETLSKEILYKYDCASFQAIMNIADCFKKIGFWTVEALRENRKFLLWIWGWAVGDSVERKNKNLFKESMPKRVTESFTVRLPRAFKYRRLLLRVVRISYDIFSWQSASYKEPSTVEDHDLFQETIKIRERELDILKRHSAELDNEVMPWWFLEAFPLTKPKNVVPVAAVNPTDEQLEEEEEEEEECFYQNVSSISVGLNYKQILFQKEIGNHVWTKPDKTNPVRYSLSMTQLRRKRQQQCPGPTYYEEPDPIDFLEANLTVKDFPKAESSDDEEQQYGTERHTTFRATLYSGAPQGTEATLYLDAIKMALSGSESFSEQDILETDKREFLDWESWRDSNLSETQVEEKFYDFLYKEEEHIGDVVEIQDKGDGVASEGKCSLTKENEEVIISENEVPDEAKQKVIEEKHESHTNHKPVKSKPKKLRTLRELLGEVTPQKSLETLHMSEDTRKTIKSILDHPIRTDLVNVTTPAEMRAFDEEVESLLHSAKDEYSEQYKTDLEVQLEPEDINLRQNSIIGGVYLIDFVQDEPQPLIDENNITTQLHYGEYKLKKWSFFAVPVVHFDAALAAERQVQQAMRQSVRGTQNIQKKTEKSEAPKKQIELEDDETIHMTLKVCNRAIWFRDPVPVMWNDEKKIWTTENIYDAKFSKQEGTIFFKLGMTSQALALSSYRWWNLPFYDFIITPGPDWNTDPCVLFHLKAREMKLDFEVYESHVILKNINYVDSKTVNHIIGVEYSPEDLIKAMRQCNIDIFPDWDTFLYVNVSLEKCRPLEDHLYMCIAFASSSFEFRGSLWNIMGGFDRILFRMRDTMLLNKDLDCILTTPLTAYISSLKEDGEEFTEDPLETDAAYRPDLKSLIELIGSKQALERMYNSPSGLVENVYKMVSRTKILCFT